MPRVLTRNLAFAGLLSATVLANWGVAHAAPSYCSPAPAPAGDANADGLRRDNVTFRSDASDGCYGVVSGNDSLADVNGLGLFGGGWAASVRDNGPAATLAGYLGLNWTLSAPQDQTSGTWTLTIADPPPSDLPVTVDMMVVLKGSTKWASYFFDDETFSISGASAGTFSIHFLNHGGQIPGLSHMTLYLRAGMPPPPPCAPTNPACQNVELPEPGSLALLTVSLAGLLLTRRRG